MAKSERLLQLLQVLRRYRRVVSGATLAGELGVSVRTLYRDIATLQSQGADIEGEPGVGYVLKPGFMLPPLMLSSPELEALVLGMRWVEKYADPSLIKAGGDALAKIASVLPAELRDELDSSTLLVGPRKMEDREVVSLDMIRLAVRRERKLQIDYTDGHGALTRRVIWPFAIGYLELSRVVVGWCETRRALRHFRADRIVAMQEMPERYPRRRSQLLKEWQDLHDDESLRRHIAAQPDASG